MLEDLKKALDDGAGRRRKKKKRTGTTTKRRVVLAPRQIDPATDQFIRSNIEFAAKENGRPNRVYNLSVAAPATAVALGGTTGVLTFTVQQDAYINGLHFPAIKSGEFVCSSLKFGSFEIVNNGFMTMAMLEAAVERYLRLVPVANRKLPTGTVVQGNFLNISLAAAGATFPSVSVGVLEEVCVTGGGVTQTKIMPGIMSLASVRTLVNRFSTKRRVSPSSALR